MITPGSATHWPTALNSSLPAATKKHISQKEPARGIRSSELSVTQPQPLVQLWRGKTEVQLGIKGKCEHLCLIFNMKIMIILSNHEWQRAYSTVFVWFQRLLIFLLKCNLLTGSVTWHMHSSMHNRPSINPCGRPSSLWTQPWTKKFPDQVIYA